MKKVYPLSLDPQVYANLKAIAEAKGISIKDALRQAIALLLADNMTLVTLTAKATDVQDTDGTTQS